MKIVFVLLNTPKAPACPASELTIMVGYLGLYEMYDGEKNVQKLPLHGG